MEHFTPKKSGQETGAGGGRTLYVSDLDGTLLRRDETISPFTAETINRLVEAGMLFSYATARSYLTASKVAAGITARIPVIVYNGAFIVDSQTQAVLLSNYFTEEEAAAIQAALFQNGVAPIVYSVLDGAEKFTYYEDSVTSGMRFFLDSRKKDVRNRPVTRQEALCAGSVFYFCCIDEEEKLQPVYALLKDRYHCIFQRDLYSGEPWLEILPKGATKANAALQLKGLLGASRVVCFGDGKNDLSLFGVAEECYAVANAVPELKACATAVIGGNAEDGVASWLSSHARVREETK